MPRRRRDERAFDGGAVAEARPLSEAFVAAALDALDAEVGGVAARDIVYRGEHSNDLAEVHLEDGRTLMLKRARYEDAGVRFATSRVAARLLREETGVVAPVYLALPPELSERPALAYWRIPLPTLKQLWPELDDADRAEALRDWGRLTRRIHGVELAGNGPLAQAEHDPLPLAEFLAEDLEDRLRPALGGAWPAGARVVARLIEAVPTVAARVGDGGGVLLHNDLHLPNVLCDVAVTGVAPECVGVLDLEDALAGPPEAELAKMQVLHGPLFRHHLQGRWFDRVLEGYGAEPDSLVLAFFRAYHLINMGFHAALIGYEAHAEEVARAAWEDANALDAADAGSARRGL